MKNNKRILYLNELIEFLKENRELLLTFAIVYLIIIITFALLFFLVQGMDANQFYCNGSGKISFLDFIYFSIVTITTIGYGDIHPVGNIAKIIVSAEAITGILVVTILFSILINVIFSRKASKMLLRVVRSENEIQDIIKSIIESISSDHSAIGKKDYELRKVVHEILCYYSSNRGSLSFPNNIIYHYLDDVDMGQQTTLDKDAISALVSILLIRNLLWQDPYNDRIYLTDIGQIVCEYLSETKTNLNVT